MQNITINWDSSLPYLMANPQFAEDPIFKELSRFDRTQDKRYFDRWCWTLMFSLHPDSMYNNLPKEERLKKAEELYNDGAELYKSSSIEKDTMLLKVKDYLLTILFTPEERNLRILIDKLDERNAFLENTPYILTNAQLVDTIMLNTSKIHTEIGKVKQLILNGNVKEAKGGSTKSMADSGGFDEVYDEA